MSIRLFLVLAVFGGSALSAECILPEADGQGPTPSPASITGVINSINSGLFILTPESHPKKKLMFRITNRTTIFTADGEFVQTNELGIGQHASIWTEYCVPVSTKKITNTAVVQLCSTDPVPCGWQGKVQPIRPTTVAPAMRVR